MTQSSKRQKTLLHFFVAPVKEEPQTTSCTDITNESKVLAHGADLATQSVPAQSNCKHHADQQVQPAISSTDHAKKCSYDLPALYGPGLASHVNCLQLQQQTASSQQSAVLHSGTGNTALPSSQEPSEVTSNTDASSVSSDDIAEAPPTASMQDAEVDAGAPTVNQYEQQVQTLCMMYLHHMQASNAFKVWRA